VVAIVGLAWGTIAQGALSTAALVAGGAACVLLSASGAAYALSHPHRGLQDRLAGTVLMPT